MHPRHAVPALAALLAAAAAPLGAQAAIDVRAQVMATPPLPAAVTSAALPRVTRRAAGRADIVAPLALGMPAARRTVTVRHEGAPPAGVRVLVETPAGPRALDAGAPLVLELAGGAPTELALRFRLEGRGVRPGLLVPVSVTLVAQDPDVTGEASGRVLLRS